MEHNSQLSCYIVSLKIMEIDSQFMIIFQHWRLKRALLWLGVVGGAVDIHALKLLISAKSEEPTNDHHRNRCCSPLCVLMMI